MAVAHPRDLCHIAWPMRERRARNVPRSVLQDYFEILAETGGQSKNKRLERILGSYAEVQYRINGGGHCSVCHASVRHVLPVRVDHADGSISDFQCLCTRCLQA